MKLARTTVLAAAVLGSALALTASAGDLTPPGGPISPTFKTLTEVEPRIVINQSNTPGDADSVYRITQPGSYYFDRSQIILIFGGAKHMLEISASNVTVDLGGFRFAGSLGSLDGVIVNGAQNNITIRNGTLADFDTAVNLANGTLSLFNVVEDLHISNSTVAGIELSSSSTVRRCIISNTSGHAISSGGDSVVQGCMIAGANRGINAGAGSKLLDNSIRSCVDGIFLSTSAVVRGNDVSDWSNTGLFSAVNSAGNRIEDNAFFGTGTGVFISGTGNILRGNTVAGGAGWDIQTNNTCYVIDATAGGTFVIGAGGGTPTTASSWVNYTY